MTGGRLKRVSSHLKCEEAFCFTYGDGISDVNITELIPYHQSQNVKTTLTATTAPGRSGALAISHGKANSFKEKSNGDGSK